MTLSMQQDAVTALSTQVASMANAQETHSRFIDEKTAELDRLSRCVEHMNVTKQDEKQFMELRKELIASMNKSLARIDDVNNKLDSTDNYIARYLPFNNFCQIIECVKVAIPEMAKNKVVKEKVDNYEQFKMKELYTQILFDDGKAPKLFEKDHLVVGRQEINALLNKDVRLSSRNLRAMKTGPLAMVKHGGKEESKPIRRHPMHNTMEAQDVHEAHIEVEDVEEQPSLTEFGAVGAQD